MNDQLIATSLWDSAWLTNVISREAAAALMCRLGWRIELLQSRALPKVPTDLEIKTKNHRGNMKSLYWPISSCHGSPLYGDSHSTEFAHRLRLKNCSTCAGLHTLIHNICTGCSIILFWLLVHALYYEICRLGFVKNCAILLIGSDCN